MCRMITGSAPLSTVRTLSIDVQHLPRDIPASHGRCTPDRKDTAEVHDYHDPAAPIIASSLQRRMPGYRTLGFTRTKRQV